MKPFYSIQELALLFESDICDVADGLIASQSSMVCNGKTADLSQWQRTLHRTAVKDTTGRWTECLDITFGHVPQPNPEHVIVSLDSLPESWRAAILEQENRPKNALRFSDSHSNHDASKWPWGDYETELLRKLALAADRFWKLYDPADNTTAPTNDVVKEWLKNEGVSDRVAEAMATMLRADGLPPGPRK